MKDWTFSSKYPFKCVSKYIPLRYDNLEHWQKAGQQTVFKFSKGIISREHKERIVKLIKDTIKGDPNKWIVCFTPAASKERTYQRYEKLAAYLSKELPCKVSLKTIINCIDGEPTHLGGKYDHYKTFVYMVNDVYKKHVILIDDIICTGTTFRYAGDKLMTCGALSVHGIIFAMTIHPKNLPVKTKNSSSMKIP